MIKMLLRMSAASLVVGVMGGCMSLDSPINGDYTGSVGERIADYQRDYCTEANFYARAIALAYIRAEVPGYPASGLCTDAERALQDEVARQVGEMPGGVDIEAAREDQRRFTITEEAPNETSQ